MNLAEIFDEVAVEMRSRFEKTRKALEHPGEKGRAFEEILRKFLRDYLPRSLDISTGMLVDANGGISRQLDVIISDSAKTPIFYRSGDLRVIPVECAYAVIEVKAYLDGTELCRAFKNMGSVRALKKSAYSKSGGAILRVVNAYGKRHEISPVNYYVFAYDSIDLKTLAEHIDSRHRADELPLDSRIDTVCVLDKGVVCNKHKDGKAYALPEPGSELCVYRTKRALLMFYALTSVEFSLATLPRFQFIDYLGDITL